MTDFQPAVGEANLSPAFALITHINPKLPRTRHAYALVIQKVIKNPKSMLTNAWQACSLATKFNNKSEANLESLQAATGRRTHFWSDAELAIRFQTNLKPKNCLQKHLNNMFGRHRLFWSSLINFRMAWQLSERHNWRRGFHSASDFSPGSSGRKFRCCPVTAPSTGDAPSLCLAWDQNPGAAKPKVLFARTLRLLKIVGIIVVAPQFFGNRGIAAEVATGAGYGIHVEGTISRVRPVRGLSETNVHSFAVDVFADKWKVRLVPANPDYSARTVTDPTGDKSFRLTSNLIEASSDGTNFVLTSLAGVHLEKLLELGEIKTVSNPRSVTRGSGTVPYGVDQEIIALWYAYASHLYFQKRPDPGFVHPMNLMPWSFYERSNIQVPGRWELMPQPPGLPAFLLTSNIIVEGGSVRRAGEDLASTNTLYEVSDTEQIADFLIPKKAKASFYYIGHPVGDNQGPIGSYSTGLSLQISLERARLINDDLTKLASTNQEPATFVDMIPWTNHETASFLITGAPPTVEAVTRMIERRASLQHGRPIRPVTWLLLFCVLVVFPSFLILGWKSWKRLNIVE